MKRMLLFLATNLAVVLVLSVTLRLLGVDRLLTQNGLAFGPLLVFSLLVGFTGSLVSLLLSKPMASWSTGLRLIRQPRDANEQWLLSTVHRLADRAGIGRPEVGVYEGGPNAFATGAFRNSALVAVSTGLLHTLDREEIEAVIGHEVSHVANGDMVTMALVQGVVNTFVVLFARVAGVLIDRSVFRSERGLGPGFYLTVLVCELVFGVLASIIVAWFSRRREFAADAGSARLAGSPWPMIHALARLHRLAPGQLPPTLRSFGIAGRAGWLPLFDSHPPVEARIDALRGR